MYNVVVGKKYQVDGQEKTRWIKVGEAFKTKSGTTVRMDSPLLFNTGDSVWLNLFLKEKADGVSQEDEKKQVQKAV